MKNVHGEQGLWLGTVDTKLAFPKRKSVQDVAPNRLLRGVQVKLKRLVVSNHVE